MRRSLLLLVVLCGQLGPLGDLARSAERPAAGLRLGMTSAQVRDVLGPPTNVSRRIILYRTHEQWHYAKPSLRLSFDQPRGSSAVLVRISTRDRPE